MAISELTELVTKLSGTLLAVIPPLLVAVVKKINFGSGKESKYKKIISSYGAYLSEEEVRFASSKIEDAVAFRLARIKNRQRRNMVLFIVNRVSLKFSMWRWCQIAPFIIQRKGRLYIPYTGKFRSVNFLYKVFAAIYFFFGLFYSYVIYTKYGSNYLWFSVFFIPLCTWFACVFWFGLPSRKKLLEVNRAIYKLDASNVNGDCAISGKS